MDKNPSFFAYSINKEKNAALQHTVPVAAKSCTCLQNGHEL
jgi:hypothetical protein